VDASPLVSVVIPVHDGGEYLAECLESILAQTYENWDCTIVDNASRDETPEIAQKYSQRDTRICHLRFEEFVSATANHNRAFAAASPDSEFCKMVQADDWIYPECLSLMVSAAHVSNTVGIVSAYQLWGRRLHLYGLPYETNFAAGGDILRGSLLGCFNVTGGPTATMLRTAFVRERRPFYEEGFRHDDAEAMLWMLSRHDLAFVHQVLTFARRQSESRYTWSSKMGSQNAEDIVFLLRYGELVLDDGEYRARLRERLRRYVWWHTRQLPRIARLQDPDFFELHRLERNLILREAKGDPDVRTAMGLIGAMLFRGRAYRRIRC